MGLFREMIRVLQPVLEISLTLAGETFRLILASDNLIEDYGEGDEQGEMVYDMETGEMWVRGEAR